MKRETEMEKISLIELNESYLPQMADLYREAFAGEPWNTRSKEITLAVDMEDYHRIKSEGR